MGQGLSYPRVIEMIPPGRQPEHLWVIRDSAVSRPSAMSPTYGHKSLRASRMWGLGDWVEFLKNSFNLWVEFMTPFSQGAHWSSSPYLGVGRWDLLRNPNHQGI
jgi:hypothetical protein